MSKAFTDSSYRLYGLPSPVSPSLEDSPNPFLAAFKAEIAPGVLNLTLSPPPLVRQLEEQADHLEAGLFPPWSSRAQVTSGAIRPALRLDVSPSAAVWHVAPQRYDPEPLWSPARAVSPAIATSSLSAFDAGLGAGFPSSGLGLSFGSPSGTAPSYTPNDQLEDYLVNRREVVVNRPAAAATARRSSAPPAERSVDSSGTDGTRAASRGSSGPRRIAHGHSRSLSSASSVDESALPPEKVTPFVWKLVKLLDRAQYAPWITWDATGQYVLVAIGQDRLRAILSLFFRHTSLKSFVRQLHIYGFRRVPQGHLETLLREQNIVRLGEGADELRHTDYAAFRHPDFCELPGGHHHECKRLARLRPNAPPTRISPVQRSTRSRPTPDQT